MPTTRKYRTRTARYEPGSAVERYILGEITADELNVAHDNIFTEYLVTSKHHHIGKQAQEIWQQHGRELLARHNYQGPQREGNTIWYDLPNNLARMVSAYGAP